MNQMAGTVPSFISTAFIPVKREGVCFNVLSTMFFAAVLAQYISRRASSINKNSLDTYAFAFFPHYCKYQAIDFTRFPN